MGVNTAAAVLRVVLEGGGIHAGPLWLVGPALQRKELVRVLPQWEPPRYDVQAVNSDSRRQPAEVARWLEYLTMRFSEIPGVFC